MMKYKGVSLAVMFVSLVSQFAPIPTEYKIVTSLNGVLISASLMSSEIGDRRKKDSAFETLKKELEKKANDNDFKRIELENKAHEIEKDLAELEQIKSETRLKLNAERDEKLSEIGTLENELNAEIDAFNKRLKRETFEKEEILKRTLEKETDRQARVIYAVWLEVCDRVNQYVAECESLLVDRARQLDDRDAQLQQYEERHQRDYQEARVRLAHQFKRLRSRLYLKYYRINQESITYMDTFLSQANEYLSSNIKSKVEEMQNYINEIGDQNESEIKESGDLFTSLVSKKNEELESSSTDEISEITLMFENYVIDYFQEFENIRMQALGMNEEIEYLRGKLNAEMKPVLIRRPRNDGDRKINDLLNWLFTDWGIICEYVSGGMNSDFSLTVNFELTKDQEKLPKKIGRLRSKELPVQLQAYFGCVSEPTIETNVALGCWVAQIPPTEGGARPRLDDSKLVPSAIAKPVSFESLESTLKEQIEERETIAQMERFMLDFVPVCPIPVPSQLAVSNQELNTIRWFYLWRNDATDGRLANIVSCEGILREVYGTQDGNFIIDGTDETLNQRIERIFQQLRLEMIDLNYG